MHISFFLRTSSGLLSVVVFRATESPEFMGSLLSEKSWPEHGVKLQGHHIGAHFFYAGCQKMAITPVLKKYLSDQIGSNFRMSHIW